MSFINVILKRLTTTQATSEAIQDGKIILEYEKPTIYLDNGTSRIDLIPKDTALSTTSTNAIENQALTNSIINTQAEVLAITEDSVPCGTKPVKEVIQNLSSITTNNSWTFFNPIVDNNIGGNFALSDIFYFYNPFTKTAFFKVTLSGVSTGKLTQNDICFSGLPKPILPYEFTAHLVMQPSLDTSIAQNPNFYISTNGVITVLSTQFDKSKLYVIDLSYAYSTL